MNLKNSNFFIPFEKHYLPSFYAHFVEENGSKILIYEDANEKFEELVNFKKIDLLGKHLYCVRTNRWKKELNWEEIVGNLKEGENKNFEDYFEIFEKFLNVYIYSCGDDYFLFTFQDITFEKQYRRILIEKNRQISYLSSELQDKSDVDIVTGVYNYQFAIANIKDCISLYKEDGTNFTLAYFNILNFTSINDEYGYEFGDSLLKEYADVLLNATRKIDVVCRMYADKFLVIYNNCDIDIARIMIKKIIMDTERKMKLPNSHIVKLNGSIIDYDTGNVNVIVRKLEQKAIENKKLGLNIIM